MMVYFSRSPDASAPWESVEWCPKCHEYFATLHGPRTSCCVNHLPDSCCHYDETLVHVTGVGPIPTIDGCAGARPGPTIGYWRAGQEHERPAVWVPREEDIAYLDDGVWTHGKDGPVILLDGDLGFWYTHEDPPPTAVEEAQR